MDLSPVLAPVRDLGAFIREQRIAAQISLRQLAKQAGVSNPYLSQVERGLRRPSADILAQIAHGLQISVESLLVMAGIIDHPGDSPAVVAAVRADPLLTERQKSSLLEIYASFRRDSEHAAEPAQAAEQAAKHLAQAAEPAAPPTPEPISEKPDEAIIIEGDVHVVHQ